jgi:hypothetical protein
VEVVTKVSKSMVCAFVVAPATRPMLMHAQIFPVPKYTDRRVVA